jgi:hypothetical protein
LQLNEVEEDAYQAMFYHEPPFSGRGGLRKNQPSHKNFMPLIVLLPLYPIAEFISPLK